MPAETPVELAAEDEAQFARMVHFADNGMTPHVLVDATLPGVRVPRHAVQEGRDEAGRARMRD